MSSSAEPREPARAPARPGIMPAVRPGRSILMAVIAALAAAAPASAQLGLPGSGNVPDPPPITAPVFGPFRSVLAQGEGQSVSATDLAANQADGTVPESFVSQQPLYAGI